jgi:8-oxo-dGTP pyrophosphatase MutT (NUDIX family)
VTSGDGFLRLADGTVRWGRFGAAGLLLRHVGDDGVARYFVARRSEWCHEGGTWAVPGGALHRDEAPLDGALREFREEIGRAPGEHTVAIEHEDDHGGWSYWTLVLDVAEPFDPPAELHWETAEVRWVTGDELTALELFPAFGATLRRLGLV